MTTSASKSYHLDQRREYENNNIVDNKQCPNRKPSYVGLSCAVSGYSDYVRYQSPSRKTSPSQIPVQNDPQTLDAALNNFVIIHDEMRQQEHRTSPPIRGQIIGGDCTDETPRSRPSYSSRKIVESRNLATLETVQKYYVGGVPGDNNLREGSPGSDCSGSSSIGSAGSGSGTLVQKQIERLYGGRVQPVRMTSPEPRSPEDKSNQSFENKPGGFFTKRFGVVKQKDYSTLPKSTNGEKDGSSSPLEFKPLPAVFNLLRPDFREQLKNNSCQVHIPTETTPVTSLGYRVTTSSYNRTVPNGVNVVKTTTTAVKERVIPIKVEDRERVIPIVKEQKVTQPFNQTHNNNDARSPDKPALPAKPLSPPPNKPAEAPVHVVTSPTLVANCFNKPTPVEKTPVPETAQSDPPKPEEYPHQEEEEEEEEDYDYRSSQSPPCGMRERALLCPIQEEDAESTASASSFRHHTNGNGVAPPPLAAAAASNGCKEPKEEVHDGHYFIKVLENEIFKFEEQICDFEEDLAADNESKKIPEEVRDSILAAIGKAKLLISQKLAQFRGLCDKNINSNQVEDPFVPTSEDLAGFWDMVYIQVEHIHSLFAELTILRKNGWIPSKPLNVSSSTLNGRKTSPLKKRGSPKVTSPASAKSTPDKKKSESAQKRDEARKKMMEERRKMMKQKKNQEAAAEVEVFVK